MLRPLRTTLQLLRGAVLFQRSPFSAATAASTIVPEQTRVVYEGKFTGKLRWLRRVSISSSVLSIVGFPIAFQLGAAGSVPFIGQCMIAATAVFTSVSSTIFLQTITSPYVAQMSEIDNVEAASDAASPQAEAVAAGTSRRFSAKRIDIFGNLKATSFDLAHVQRVNTSAHPFATFCDADKRYYYVFSTDVRDPTLAGKFAP